VDSTRIRRVETTAVLLGLPGAIFDAVADALQRSGVGVFRVGNMSAACERLPQAMPQVVVVLGALKAPDRETLVDRATAVGAAVIEAPPGLEPSGVDDLADRALRAALERKLRRDADAAASAGGAATTPPKDDVDDNW
jgi:hypothetical protein